MRSIFLDRNTFAESVRFPASRLPDCHWWEYARTAPGEILANAAGAEVIVTNKVRLPGEVLEKLPDLKLVAVAATGVDHIDLGVARRLGIGVCNVRGYAVNTVPEHVFALLFALRRHLIDYDRAVRNGDCSRAEAFCLHTWPIQDLAGSTLGIIGGGSLGQGVAHIAQAFRMRVLIAERRGAAVHAGRVSFDEVLRESDALSLHVPLTADTRDLISAAELACMKPTAVLINTARGGVVDETALLQALRERRIAGAALDVLAHEPPPVDHPLLAAKLPNLIITPHIAWASHQAQQKLADEVVENIAAYLRGERRNRVV